LCEAPEGPFRQKVPVTFFRLFPGGHLDGRGVSRPQRRAEMTDKKEEVSGVEGLAKTRTYGKFRCHNPSCMGRLQPTAGQKQVKCPVCGMEFRVHWIRPDFPRIRGPVWDVNRKIAEEAFAQRAGKKATKKGGK
jgi:hypothetical protein